MGRALLRAHGAFIRRLCDHADVSASNAWVTDDFFRLWEKAQELLEDPSAGLRFGSEGIAGGYGVASIVALHAPDLRQALSALSRYKRLTCPEIVEIDTVGLEVAVRYRWLQASGAPPRLLVDVTMASLCEMVRQGTDGQVRPARLELARRSADLRLLEDHFDCPVILEAEQDAMVFERSALDAPFATADENAFGRVLKGLEARLESGEGYSGLVGQTRIAIARQLSEGRSPSVASIARRIGLSPRTLQRRLDDCGTGFQDQLAAVRRTTANRLLADTDLDPVAISMLLGFSEPNSFTRAFRNWERTTPLRWRDRQATVQA
ncbi:hypothetical protein LTR94_024442 [Friedmanniomyces endolithicus]|nr:hypothetical protein LTR94_024442 [Friedmanniomyces endolithicus]